MGTRAAAPARIAGTFAGGCIANSVAVAVFWAFCRRAVVPCGAHVDVCVCVCVCMSVDEYSYVVS